VTWNPDTYLAFADHRERPIAELIGRIPPIEPRVGVDLGCGTGNSTAALAHRFPAAAVTGVDNSEDMLAKARADAPEREWILADIGSWTPGEPQDIILSNAALQWVPDHDHLIPRLADALSPGGALAVQMPRNFAAPSHQLLYETVENGPWADQLNPLLRRDPVDEPARYYDRLAPRVQHLDIWETTYMQVLEGDDPVFRWTSGTALTPFLSALEGAARDAFAEAYKKKLRAAYPKAPDGETLFPFTRLFIVAIK
jgi:trans-aconitate 2-methyltransferase